MFILRKIIERSETNYELGIQYSIVHRFEEQELFQETFDKVYGYKHVADLDVMADNYTRNCYAFIITNDYQPIPLYFNQKNYIMTENGKTFSNLSYK